MFVLYVYITFSYYLTAIIVYFQNFYNNILKRKLQLAKYTYKYTYNSFKNCLVNYFLWKKKEIKLNLRFVILLHYYNIHCSKTSVKIIHIYMKNIQIIMCR